MRGSTPNSAANMIHFDFDRFFTFKIHVILDRKGHDMHWTINYETYPPLHRVDTRYTINLELEAPYQNVTGYFAPVSRTHKNVIYISCTSIAMNFTLYASKLGRTYCA